MTSSKINQGRDAPAFQEYAASMMSRMEYRLLNLNQRGLLYTLRLECWVNQSLPRDPKKLAIVLGLQIDEVTTALPSLAKFFNISGELLTCAELEKYREHVQDRRNRQSEGGKESRRRYKEKLASTGGSNGEGTFNHDASSLQVLRQDKSNTNKSNTAFRKGMSIQDYLDENDCPF
jgi:hypothetical protein